MRHKRSGLPTVVFGSLLPILLAGQSGCTPMRQDARRGTASGSPKILSTTNASSTLGIPAGCVVAANATPDPKTGLPTRIVHERSGIALILVQAGELVLKKAPGTDRSPGGAELARERKLVIRNLFYLGETEVTVSQFRRFAEETGYRTDAERGVPEGDNTLGGFSEVPKGKGQHRQWNPASNWRNPLPKLADLIGQQRLSSDWPVVQVTWNDAKTFAAHFGFKLPSEAQWEYACRAGTSSTFPWGETVAVAGHANVADSSFSRLMDRLDDLFPFDDHAPTLANTASYQPNAWGLYDMIGNVEEWCEDEWHSKMPEDPVDESAVVATGPGEHDHVIRGGSWISGPDGCGSGERHALLAQCRREWVGFRVAAAVRRVAGADRR